jgi:hypothetical protein
MPSKDGSVDAEAADGSGVVIGTRVVSAGFAIFRQTQVYPFD